MEWQVDEKGNKEKYSLVELIRSGVFMEEIRVALNLGAQISE